ncbi:unnamed protein product [Prunus armeniaca]
MRMRFSAATAINSPAMILKKELAHIIKRHKHAPNVQGLRALDNRKRCRLCVHKNGYDHAKVIIDQSALDKHMDKVHPRWEDLYPRC